MNLEVLFINLTTSPIHHLKLKYCPSHIAVGRREQSRQGEGGPGQRQEIPMQHELFSSIVPPEQLFVPQPPPRHKLQRPPPSIGPLSLTAIHCCSMRQPHRHHHCERNNPKSIHTHAVHLWAVTQQCWGLTSKDQKARGSPPTQSKVPLWLDRRQRGTLLYTEPPNSKNTQVQRRRRSIKLHSICCLSRNANSAEARLICGKRTPFLSRSSRQAFFPWQQFSIS